jgi:molybdenum cofactor synthesis domain-containing protein
MTRSDTEPAFVTACVLIVGNEILSGRTQDANLAFLARGLDGVGIRVREARVIADVATAIITTLNAVRHTCDYVFTTGGIGPTHDDITADAIAAALGVGISEDPRAIKILLERIRAEDLNEARRRMARIPHGAELIENKISKAPGFWIENVIVLAGVPAVMQAMLDDVTPKLARGVPMVIETIPAGSLPEGAYASPLRDLAAANPDLTIGSYPSFHDGRFHNEIVVRGKDAAKVVSAAAAINGIVAELSKTHG